jgi:hypothetical protein
MTPNILRYKNYRFFFFSREESRMHVHVRSSEGEAKFWIKPMIALADYSGYSERQIRELAKIVEKYEKEIQKSWELYFGC